MTQTMTEVLEFIEENDVKFIRLAFCDIFGKQKNISIMPAQLPRAFETGISFDASVIRGFMDVAESDLFLVPDPATLAVLPWRPSQGRVVRFFCDIRRPDGTPFEGSGRDILRRTVKKAADMGYVCKIGSECEFYLFERDEDGNPTMIPHDHGTYCDIAPLDKGENVRREICLTLEEMGIQPESSHHEQGPGQNEIDFQYSHALEAADDLVTFRAAVKNIAAQNGLFASFMPKPFPDKSGNGLHINMSLSQNGRNIFKTNEAGHSKEAESFLQGIMDRIPEITAFLNPLTNSYARFGEFEAPRYLTWSHQNRSQLIRVPAATGKYSRIELRSPDPSCNPYLAYSLLIAAGLEGIAQKKKLCAPTNLNLFDVMKEQAKTFETLPGDLWSALQLAKNSSFVAEVLPQATIEKYMEQKEAEYLGYKKALDKHAYEQDQYFLQI